MSQRPHIKHLDQLQQTSVSLPVCEIYRTPPLIQDSTFFIVFLQKLQLLLLASKIPLMLLLAELSSVLWN